MELKLLQASKTKIRIWLILTFALPMLTAMLLSWIFEPKDIENPQAPYFIGGVLLITFIAPLLTYIYVKKYRISIKNDSITIYGFWKRKEIIISEYYSFDMRSVYGVVYFNLYKKGADKPSEVISMTGIDKQYFADRLRNHDEIYSEDENKELLTINGDIDKEQVNKRMEEARKIIKGISIIICLLSFYSLIKPVPIVMDTLVLAPLAFIPILWRYKGFIKFGISERSKFANADFIIFPGLVLFLRAFIDWHVISYKYAFVPTLTIGVLIGTLIIIPMMKTIKTKKITEVVCAYLLFIMYGFGTSVYINCKYDDVPPNIFNVSVVDMRVSSDNYYITIDSWLDESIEKEIKVSRNQYNKLHRRDTISVCVKEGKLGIPWFYVILPTAVRSDKDDLTLGKCLYG